MEQSAAALAATARADRTLDSAESLCTGATEAVDAPIRSWLERKGAEVVLPPEVEAPLASVIDESWEIDGREVHLANFVVAAAILGTALALIGWYAWREYGMRGGGPGTEEG